MNKNVAEIQRSLAAVPQKSATSFRLVRREWSKELKGMPGETVIGLAKHLIRLGPWERLFAYEMIVHHPAALQSLSPKDITHLGRGIHNWGEVDSFACYVAGPAWRQHSIPDTQVQDWARSPDRWWKRAALVSTVPLNNHARGGTGDTVRTLKICRMLVRDRDDMVVKALSWTLRELSKRDPAAVRRFLRKYEEVLPSRVNREVRNKLQTGLKNPGRRAELQVEPKVISTAGAFPSPTGRLNGANMEGKRKPRLRARAN